MSWNIITLTHSDRKFDVSTVLLRINAGGVHLIFDILGGAFIQGRRLHEGGVYYKIQRKVTILYIKVNDFVVLFHPKNGIIQ